MCVKNVGRITMTKQEMPVEHILYKDGDANLPQPILDMNGQVALACCKVCGEYEAGLDNPCIPKLLVEQVIERPSDGEIYARASKQGVVEHKSLQDITVITTKLLSEIVGCLEDCKITIECYIPKKDRAIMRLPIDRILAELGEAR